MGGARPHASITVIGFSPHCTALEILSAALFQDATCAPSNNHICSGRQCSLIEELSTFADGALCVPLESHVQQERPETVGSSPPDYLSSDLLALDIINALPSLLVLYRVSDAVRPREGHHMSELCQPSAHKRRHTQDPSQNKDPSYLPSKRRKVEYPACETPFQPPAAFWDNLSKISLTKRSLKELERRNAQTAPKPSRLSHRQLRRPLTRQARAEVRRRCWAFKPATEVLSDCSAGCLKDIKRLASHGGPDISQLRGYLQPIDPLTYAMSSSQSRSRGRKRQAASTSKTKSTSRTTATRNTNPYDRDFQQNLIDHGVYPEEYEHPDGREAPIPDNWDEINRRLIRSRASMSPSKFSDQDFKAFKRANAHAFKEKQVTSSVIPIIEGKIGDGRCTAGGIPFNNLDHLTDGNIVPGNPDIFYGARPEQLDRRVRNALNTHIVPSTQDDLPMVPNFFVAAKGPGGTLAVAGTQASYDGALGARGVHSLQTYGKSEPVYDNNAYTITTIYHGGTLKLYTVHPTQPSEPGHQPKYYMNQLRSFSVTDTIETFRHGANAYRNGKDLAKEWRDDFIRAANGRTTNLYTASASFESSPDAEVSTSTPTLEVAESETSADELALGNVFTSFSKRARREHSDLNKETSRRDRNLESVRR